MAYLSMQGAEVRRQIDEIRKMPPQLADVLQRIKLGYMEAEGKNDALQKAKYTELGQGFWQKWEEIKSLPYQVQQERMAQETVNWYRASGLTGEAVNEQGMAEAHTSANAIRNKDSVIVKMVDPNTNSEGRFPIHDDILENDVDGYKEKGWVKGSQGGYTVINPSNGYTVYGNIAARDVQGYLDKGYLLPGTDVKLFDPQNRYMEQIILAEDVAGWLEKGFVLPGEVITMYDPKDNYKAHMILARHVGTQLKSGLALPGTVVDMTSVKKGYKVERILVQDVATQLKNGLVLGVVKKPAAAKAGGISSGASQEVTNAVFTNVPYSTQRQEGKAEAGKQLNNLLIGSQDEHYYFSNSLVYSTFISINSNLNAKNNTKVFGNVIGIFASATDSYNKAKSDLGSTDPRLVYAYAGLLFAADRMGSSDGSPSYSGTIQIIEDYFVGNYNEAIIRNSVGLVYMGQTDYKYLIKDKDAREEFILHLADIKKQYENAKTKRPHPKFNPEYNAFCDGFINRIDTIINMNLNYNTSVKSFNYEVAKILSNPQVRSELYEILRR